MPTLPGLLLLLCICSVFCHAFAGYEYESFTLKQSTMSDNTTAPALDNTSLPVCPLNVAPRALAQQSDSEESIKKTRQSSRLPTEDLKLLMAVFKSSARNALTTITEQVQQALHATTTRAQQVDYGLFFQHTKDHILRTGGNVLKRHVRPIGYGIRRMVWPLVYGFDDKKDELLQWLQDVGTHPQLEWYIFTTRLTDHWTHLSHRLGIDVFVRHLRQRLSAYAPAPPFSHLDDLFKTMLETDHHSKFYRQQMAHYYQYLSPQDQERVRYSKREFTQWAKDSALKTHDFVIVTQQDWIHLMQSLYYDMELMLECLSLPPPTHVVASDQCLPHNRRQAWLLLSPPTSTVSTSADDDGAHHYTKTSPSSSKRQRYEWMYQLEQIHRELETTMNCICPPQDLHHQHSHDDQQTFAHKRIDGAPSSSPRRSHVPNNLESIEMLANLKKSMLRRFTRLDKELYRDFYAATPPTPHQPMHYIYDRLRENVSAMNKSTYDSYLTRLILSWTSMMATTLDTANSVADDLSWLLLHTKQQDAGSMALIWASAQRKMEKNNAQLINQWEVIFTDLDHDLQAAWTDMLALVDQSHRSSFERVQTFWSQNKARLATFFSSLFPTTGLENP